VLKEMNIGIIPMRKIDKMGLSHLVPDEHPTAKHGLYLDIDKFNRGKTNLAKHILNGRYFDSGYISPGYISQDGTKHQPDFYGYKEVEIGDLDELKSPGDKLIRINMITNLSETNKKWKWDEYKSSVEYYQITSLATAGQHYFCLDLYIEKPFKLATYPGGEPQSKPTTYGKVIKGSLVANIIINSRSRPLYKYCRII